jgi:histone H2A
MSGKVSGKPKSGKAAGGDKQENHNLTQQKSVSRSQLVISIVSRRVAPNMSSQLHVYFAAVLKYLAAEILELAGNAA